ncbi:hypothetical protein NGA_0628720 [Nannochloropsis gaditana CCMP526]|uniref:uncharacterized protein n=1 Tax=Nannochloropsis gaditana (strain CCMP526) TaxID=1093141 RepID=UPI00029F6959|nr:hypothetical protein NGA_0628720 [Nannochloropsis gaditana CCMP526]EKU20914.1 hypothetical protein NGA_0628720 [Nannochloropsis gaditana CCMP526]|eukprot:XP_005855455.1 hypothetical protein NGA_0628720 [Nannochloropsis gaditana CCMP526]
MITSEDLRQLSRIARILGSPLHGLRLYCDASIEGLQDVKGFVLFTIAPPSHNYAKDPVSADELNEAKHILVEAGTAELSDIIPVHVFCEATYEEVEKALIKDVRLPQLISSPKGVGKERQAERRGNKFAGVLSCIEH